MKFPNTSAVIFALVILSAGCVVSGKIQPTVDPGAAVDTSRLWEEPVDLAARDVLHGPGGVELRPHESATFTFVAADRSGYSAGYDVRDANGLEWSVKLGPEAQPEVAVSRILWALGYHQPPTYYLSSWTMTGDQAGPQAAGRFRPKLPDRKVVGEWSWYENDFINTQPFRGLVVVNVMLNNWDWKTSNNKIYEIGGEHFHVVQDLGASLGKTSYPRLLAWLPMRGLGQGSRNDLEDFETQGFIESVNGEGIDFIYRGIHHSLIEELTPRDVVWTAEQMSRLSDAQWHDAFRAAGYSDDYVRRYVAKIKHKITEGFALKSMKWLGNRVG
jgi:hypothetical protein